MAISADVITKVEGHARRNRIKVAASTTLYDGQMCFFDADGYVSSTAGGSIFAGIATERVDNSSGADGDKQSEAVCDGLCTPKGFSHSLTIANLGDKIYASDNGTLTTTSASNSLIGTLRDVDDDGNPVILLDGQAA